MKEPGGASPTLRSKIDLMPTILDLAKALRRHRTMWCAAARSTPLCRRAATPRPGLVHPESLARHSSLRTRAGVCDHRRSSSLDPTNGHCAYDLEKDLRAAQPRR